MTIFLKINKELDSDLIKLLLLVYAHCNYNERKMSIINFIEDCVLNVEKTDFISIYKDFFIDYNKKEKDGFVYIMQDYSGLYKIGYSQNPEDRLSQLKTGNPKISMYNNYPANKMDEKLLHKLFEKNRNCGEWFNLKSKDLKWIDNYFFNQNQ